MKLDLSSASHREGPDGEEAPHRLKHGYASSEITRRLILAIFEQRLPPGARITESQLAEAFNVSRTVVRLSMNKLSEIGVFIKTPNIGHVIASPSRREAGMMLEMRHMIEPPMARAIGGSIMWRISSIMPASRRLGEAMTWPMFGVFMKTPISDSLFIDRRTTVRLTLKASASWDSVILAPGGRRCSKIARIRRRVISLEA